VSNQTPSEDEPRVESPQKSSEQAPQVTQTPLVKEAKTTEEEKESIKLIFDTNKHITTLSAGSSLLLVTFMKDLLPKNAQGGLAVTEIEVLLIVFSLICFGLVICFAAYAMHKCSIWMRNPVAYHRDKLEMELKLIPFPLFGLGAEVTIKGGETPAQGKRAYETPLVTYPIIIYVLGLSVFSGAVISALFL
jgi:hypothetical protein